MDARIDNENIRFHVLRNPVICLPVPRGVEVDIRSTRSM